MSILKEYSKRIYIAPTPKGQMVCDKEYYNSMKFKNAMFMSEHFVKITIEEDGDKYKMKSLLISKTRNKSPFFRKDVFVGTFSYNRKTKMMYTSNHIKPYGKKNLRSKVRLFRDISSVMMSTSYRALDSECVFKLPHGEKRESIHDKYREMFKEYTKEIFGEEIYRGDCAIFLARLRYNNVKTPDNWRHFIKFNDDIDFTKDSQCKLIDSILDYYQLNFKSIRKLMNELRFENPEFPITKTMMISFQKLSIILGKKHFLSLDKERLFYGVMKDTKFYFMNDLSLSHCKTLKLSDFERKNLKKIVTECIQTNVNDINQMCNYIRVTNSLKDFKSDFKIRATTITQMNEDYDEYNNTLFQLTNGVYHREYDQGLIELFKDKIDGYDVVFLSETADYIEEAMVQRNCLRNYHNANESIIVSIRDENDKRISCEYVITKTGIERTQTLGFANKEVDFDIHGKIIKEVDRIMFDYYKKYGMDFKVYQEGIQGYTTNTTLDDSYDFMYLI